MQGRRKGTSQIQQTNIFPYLILIRHHYINFFHLFLALLFPQVTDYGTHKKREGRTCHPCKQKAWWNLEERDCCERRLCGKIGVLPYKPLNITILYSHKMKFELIKLVSPLINQKEFLVYRPKLRRVLRRRRAKMQNQKTRNLLEIL